MHTGIHGCIYSNNHSNIHSLNQSIIHSDVSILPFMYAYRSIYSFIHIHVCDHNHSMVGIRAKRAVIIIPMTTRNLKRDEISIKLTWDLRCWPCFILDAR